MSLMILRPVGLLGTAIADLGSVEPGRSPHFLAGLVMLLSAGYTLWPGLRYFGLPRALRGDGFRDRCRDIPMIREGAFRYNANAMCSFAFLLLWSIGMLTGSRAALALALCQHACIWVHMYCTNALDMRV